MEEGEIEKKILGKRGRRNEGLGTKEERRWMKKR
jgi:hypothetical protein